MRSLFADNSLNASLRALVSWKAPGTRLFLRAPQSRKYTWNGTSLAPSGITYESALHDIAHLLIANKNELRHPEFGLGYDPYRDSDAEAIYDSHVASNIEHHTVTLGLALCHFFNLSVQDAAAEVQAKLPSYEDFTQLRSFRCGILPRKMWNKLDRDFRRNLIPQTLTFATSSFAPLGLFLKGIGRTGHNAVALDLASDPVYGPSDSATDPGTFVPALIDTTPLLTQLRHYPSIPVPNLTPYFGMQFVREYRTLFLKNARARHIQVIDRGGDTREAYLFYTH